MAEGEEDDGEYEDPVKFLTRAHFEMAFSAARRSVSQSDLAKFDLFRQSQDPMYAAKQAGKDGKALIAWPEDHNALPGGDDDDDMYA